MNEEAHSAMLSLNQGNRRHIMQGPFGISVSVETEQKVVDLTYFGFLSVCSVES